VTFLEGITMTDPAIDPHRLLIAAHELGHALAWRALGFTVDEVWVKGRGPAAHGRVWLDITHVKPWTLTHERGFHTGLFAGREAELRWCNEHGLPINEASCSEDMAQHARRRRTSLGRQVRPREAEAEARRLVRRYWPRLVRLAPHLAIRGSLPTSRI
jgi:hypothetical protein